MEAQQAQQDNGICRLVAEVLPFALQNLEHLTQENAQTILLDCRLHFAFMYGKQLQWGPTKPLTWTIYDGMKFLNACIVDDVTLYLTKQGFHALAVEETKFKEMILQAKQQRKPTRQRSASTESLMMLSSVAAASLPADTPSTASASAPQAYDDILAIMHEKWRWLRAANSSRHYQHLLYKLWEHWSKATWVATPSSTAVFLCSQPLRTGFYKLLYKITKQDVVINKKPPMWSYATPNAEFLEFVTDLLPSLAKYYGYNPTRAWATRKWDSGIKKTIAALRQNNNWDGGALKTRQQWCKNLLLLNSVFIPVQHELIQHWHMLVSIFGVPEQAPKPALLPEAIVALMERTRGYFKRNPSYIQTLNTVPLRTYYLGKSMQTMTRDIKPEDLLFLEYVSNTMYVKEFIQERRDMTPPRAMNDVAMEQDEKKTMPFSSKRRRIVRNSACYRRLFKN